MQEREGNVLSISDPQFARGKRFQAHGPKQPLRILPAETEPTAAIDPSIIDEAVEKELGRRQDICPEFASLLREVRIRSSDYGTLCAKLDALRAYFEGIRPDIETPSWSKARSLVIIS